MSKTVELILYSEQVALLPLIGALIYLSHAVHRVKHNQLFQQLSRAFFVFFLLNVIVTALNFYTFRQNDVALSPSDKEFWGIIIFSLNVISTYLILYALKESVHLEKIFSTKRIKFTKKRFQLCIGISLIILFALKLLQLHYLQGSINPELVKKLKYCQNTLLALLNFFSLYAFNKYIKDEGVLPFEKWFYRGISGLMYIQLLPIIFLLLIFMGADIDVINLVQIFAGGLFIAIIVILVYGLNDGLIEIHEKQTEALTLAEDNKRLADVFDRILGGTFHEIILPLTQIETQLNRLDKDTEESNDLRISKQVHKVVEIVNEAHERLRSVIHASMEMYKAENSEEYLKLKDKGLFLPIRERYNFISINELLEVAMLNFKSAVHTNNVSFTREYAKGCVVKCNSIQLVQVFLNTIKNSYEAKLPDSTCRIFLKTNIINISETKFVQVEIEDNGIGIPEDIQEKVFELGFSTKEGEFKEKRGFGLSIIRDFTLMNNGQIRLESPVKEPRVAKGPAGSPGTKFIFIFPKA